MNLKSNIETIISKTYQTLKNKSQITYKHLKKLKRLYNPVIGISENIAYYYFLSNSTNYVKEHSYDPVILIPILMPIAAYVLNDGITRIFDNENLFQSIKKEKEEAKRREKEIQKKYKH